MEKALFRKSCDENAVMKTQSLDTSPEMEKIYFDLLRKETRSRRLTLTRALTASAITRERQMIQREHPTWSEQEVSLYWASIAYGQETADKLRDALKRQRDKGAN